MVPGRKVLVHTYEHARLTITSLKEENDALKREIKHMIEELREVNADLRELRITVLKRQEAEAKVEALHRERDEKLALFRAPPISESLH
jgi:hypothetical protein